MLPLLALGMRKALNASVTSSGDEEGFECICY